MKWKKRTSRMLSLFLAVLMICSMLPLNTEVSAAYKAEESTLLSQSTKVSAVNEALLGSVELPVGGINTDVTATYEVHKAATNAPMAVALGDVEYYDTIEDAAVELREGMVNREDTIIIYYTYQGVYDESTAKSIASQIFDAALEHTGVPNEGDYLKWQCQGFAEIGGSILSGTCYLTYTYTVSYYTTAEQEAEVTAKLKEVMEELNLYSDSLCDYQKVKLIYDYICDNVTYDYDHLDYENLDDENLDDENLDDENLDDENLDDSTYMLQYTAYAALINGTSVCQGYANLFYRMALEAGIDARFISGTAYNGSVTEAHGWNIVKLGDYYYNVDSTWDAVYKPYGYYSYFLTCENTFGTDHFRNASYTTTAFNTAYPMATSDYDLNQEHSFGTPVFTWEDDYSACTATFTCSAGDSSRTVDCTVSSGTVEATCAAEGKTTYTAVCTFNGTEYIDEKTVTIPKTTDHSWDDGEITLDPSCTADGLMTYTCTVCGTKKTEAIEATGHNYQAVVTDPTCTEDGYTTYTCTVCGDSYTDDETVATGHTWDDGEVTTEPTCVDTGVKTYTCTVCGETKTEVIPATGEHDYEAVVTDPTCTEGGYTTYTCTVCGDSYTDDETEAMGHDYEAVVTDPTCTEGGYTTYTCTVCGDSYIDDKTDATGHTWDDGEVTTEPTCVGTGIKTYTCTVCGETKTEEIPATGEHVFDGNGTCIYCGYVNHTHTYSSEPVFEWADEYDSCEAVFTCDFCDNTRTVVCTVTVNTTDATCTEDGKTVYTATCTLGEMTYSDTQTVVIPAGHKTEIQNARDATCTEKGYTGDEVCTVCGETVTFGEEIPATGHTAEIQNARDATCTEDGYTGDEVCTVCGETVTFGKDIPATGHTEAEAVKEREEAATCTTDGSYDLVVYCSTCGVELSRETITVDALGHTFGEWETVTSPTCEDEGSEQRTCTVCGYTETRNTAATGHDWEEDFTIDQKATCTTDGSQSIHCKNCEAIKDSEVIPATGHSWNDGEITTKATCTEPGVKTYTCTACQEQYTEVIPATGHTEAEAVKENEVEVTCTKDGSYDLVVYCSVCGEELSRETIITEEATGHKWKTDYTVDVEAACTTDGSQSIHCEICDAVQEGSSEVIPATGHSWNDGEIITKATCTEDGSMIYTCTVCGETKTEAIPATGHTEAEAVKENEIEVTCTKDGSYDSVVYCAACGVELSRTTIITDYATGHTLTHVEARDADCEEAGNIEYWYCEVCGNYYSDEAAQNEITKNDTVLSAPGHTWDSGVVTKEATETEDGVKTFTCTVCGATRTETISATGGSEDSEYWDEVMEEAVRLQNAGGGTLTIEGDSNRNALPGYAMKYLLENPDVTLVFEYTYDGVDYTIVIPAGTAVDDDDTEWYGPLWLYEHYGSYTLENISGSNPDTDPGTDTDAADVDSAATGDSEMPVFWLAVMAAAVCAAVIAGKRRKYGK